MLLNCHSYYSLNYGCLGIREVLENAQQLGHKLIALTDINNTSETFRFLKLAKEFNIKPIVGIDFRNGMEQQFVALAEEEQGFFEMNELLSKHLTEETPIPKKATFNHCFVVYPFKKGACYDNLLENEFIGVNIDDVNRPFFEKSAKQYSSKMVVFCTATFRTKRDFNAHRLLRAIGENTLLSKLSENKQAKETDKYRSHEEITKAYANFPDIIENTEKILAACSFKFDFNKPRNNKQHFTKSKSDDAQLLRKLAYEGLPYRYGFNPQLGKKVNGKQQEILNRLENELKTIEEYDFCAYFLINWDMINYARSKNFPHVGRGSGANSMVAYLVQITNVDPVELDLYFERFINPHRSNPPDFDIDFSWTDRDEMTRYLFEKYGWNKVALLGAYVTYQRKAVIRELGKVFGLPSEEIEQLQRGVVPDNEYGSLILKYSSYIAGFPSYLSIHSSGIIISEEAIHSYSATHLPPKNFPTVHFDMQIAEDIGLHKFDVLSQRGLGKIKDAVTLIEKNRGVKVDIHKMSEIKADQKVKDLMREGDLTGCFYVESPAMRMLMTKLRADDYTRLVAASSIIRPGVSKSGMMREYILRFREEERREVARKELPELYEILEETYGVMVYQEDVLKIAHYFAGLSLADADILRRGMSWKFKQRSEFSKIKNRFFENCRRKNYPLPTVQKIWNQIESFANFAFSKGHSASYAVESFQALYLHAYYPIEYLTATLNNGGGFYSRELYVHTAKMKGANIELPCVNKSLALADLEGNTLRLGFGFIGGGFESKSLQLILSDRQKNGPFLSFRDFIKRLPEISLDQIIILIRLGCFRIIETSKKKLLWDAHFLLSGKSNTQKRNLLFNVEAEEWKLPDLSHNSMEDALAEIEYLGFAVSLSPFDLISKEEKLPDTTVTDFKNRIGKTVSIAAYRVHSKPTKTSNGKIMQFGTFIDREGRWVDTVMFPEVSDKNRYVSPGCYLIKGVLSEEFEHISLEVSELKRYDTKAII